MAELLPFRVDNFKLADEPTPFQALTAIEAFNNLGLEINTKVNTPLNPTAARNGYGFSFVSTPKIETEEQREHYFVFGSQATANSLVYQVRLIMEGQPAITKKYKLCVSSIGQILADVTNDKSSYSLSVEERRMIDTTQEFDKDDIVGVSHLGNDGWESLLVSFPKMDLGRLNDLYADLLVCEEDARQLI